MKFVAFILSLLLPFTVYAQDEVLGKSNLTVVNAIPYTSSSGTLNKSTLLADETNARIYFDRPTPVHTSIIGDTGKGVRIGGNNQLTDVVLISSPNAGTTFLEIFTSKTTGAVGGGAFIRNGSGATIGQGWQTNSSATWDADLLAGGYDFSLNNKNNSGNLNLGAGLDIIFRRGIGETAPITARLTDEGLHFKQSGMTIGIDISTPASSCMGDNTFNGITPVTINTTCAKSGMTVHLDQLGPSTFAPTNCWKENVVDGTSFDVACQGNNDAGFTWTIIHGTT